MVAIFSLALAVWLGSLDQSIANTLLPAIAADLQHTPAESVVVIHAYQLAVVATLLPFAALGDRLGARRIFLSGVAIFNLAALGSAFAPSLEWLAVSRALQGIGAGGVMSVNLALVRRIFPPDQLGRGTGLNAFIVGMGYSLGPTVASLLQTVVSWQWLFGLQFPIGLVGWLLARKHLPATPPLENASPYDRMLALWSALCFAALIFFLSAVAQQKSATVMLVALAVTLLSGALLLHRQRGHAHPMLPVDLLSRPLFGLSVFTSYSAFTTQGLAFVALPFFLQQELQRPTLETGLLMTTWAVVVALSAPLAGPLSDRYPPAILGGIGLSILSVGMGLISHTSASTPMSMMVLSMVVCGFGFGMFQSPNLRAIMSTAPPHRSSGASAMVALARLTGQASGAALVALSFNLHAQHGASLALTLGCATAGVGGLLSILRLWAR